MVALVSRTGRQTQRYCSDGCQCRQVVGCVPYRYRTVTREDGVSNRELEVLVIRSQKGQGLMFPKGGWELDETMEEAAERETFEEAGVAGVLDCEILGKWCYKGKSNGVSHEGYIYPLFVTDQSETWPEKNTRIRIWLTIDEARASNMPSWMKQALEAFLIWLQNPIRSAIHS
ncbi:hypothetical protein QQ045_014477 [Rhodiola kirilowii]